MIKKQTLVVLVLLCASFMGFGQSIFTNPITGTNPNTANPYTTGQAVDPNLTVSGIGRGSGIGGNDANDRYNANSWNTIGLDLTAYFEFTITPNSGYQINFSNFVYTGQASGTGPESFAFRSSLDGFTSNIGSPTVSGTTIDLSSVSYQNITTPITFRFYGWDASGSGGTFSINDFTFNGTVYCTDAVDYGITQFPIASPQSITVGDNFEVYAQVYEPGITNDLDDPDDAGDGIEVWIGYSNFDTEPSTWTNWIPATFNLQSGNNDEFMAEIGSGLSPGTYYYASRFSLNSCDFTYGSTGGTWNNDSVQLIVEDDTLDFYNLQFPEVGSIIIGNIFDVFGQVYEVGLTPGIGQATGISAWVGYSTTNTDPSTWTNWEVAGYNPFCLDCNSDQNDEYFVDIGSGIPSVGIYYYATRFKLNSGLYTYGGILDDGSAGGQWDGITYISGVLTVNPVPCSDLIISEYVEGSGNNKYLEIFNPTGSTIDLSNYALQLYSNESATPTTTSALSGTLASGTTVVYQDASATAYLGPTTNLAAINFNGDDAIALVKNSSTIIDVIGQIGFDPGTEWTGGSASTVNRTLVRKSSIQYGDYNSSDTFAPNLEWNVYPIDDVSDLGYHFSDCIPSNELQLQLPVGINITCEDSYTFSTTTINSNNDVVLRIQNLGSLSLNITDLSFGIGTNYILVSPPATPFSIAGSSYQDITIRFNPTTIGLLLDTLTISSDDTSESLCSIDLSGIAESNCATTTVTLAAQDFESAVTDTWSYTANHPGTDFPNNWGVNSYLEFPDMSSSISGAQSGSNFWGITDLERSGHENQTHQLSFDYTGLNTYDNSQLSFYYYTIGVDASDSFDYEIFYDSVSQGIIDISTNNDAWTQVLVNIPNSVDNLQIIFYADLDAQFDLAGIDNIELTSTTINTTTWDGSSWDNGLPNTSTVAIIDSDYITNATHGNFSACNLFINAGSKLTIANGYYIEVENNLTVDGEIVVNPKGAFIQNNDDGTVTVATKTSITVEKETALMNQWYEYTYWSSPVEDETIDLGLSDSATNRRFLYNAQNYRDSFQESANGNNLTSGQDDIDDDAPWDWQTASDIMQAGVGYASTLDATIFNSTPGCSNPTGCQIKYTFEGPFNNGVITVPVYRNDGELLDNNWNFLGNPYPSAIDADDFLMENAVIDNAVEDFSTNGGVLDGAIFFWSQWTPPSRSTNGNQISNFSQSDYAIINTIGETAGGDGIKPERIIPSGQGFFISYANTGATTSINGSIASGEVIFNNSMRVADGTSNSQFFRTSGESSAKSKKLPNKLWVNLTSDNGVFNQIAIGYVENATDGYDGMGYDTPRNLSSELFSSIYTSISGETKKFAIQGKDPNSLDLNEVVPLGFDTSIDVATLYTLSVEKVEGDFLSSNPIYLKDNLMNTVHNLSASDYSFTSDVGEFKDRFEMVFQSETLSDTEALLNSNKLTIIELNDGRVQIKTHSNFDIKSVKIMDILGRTLYQLKGTSPTEIYNLSNLSQTAYIAKVELSNGQIITKRAIKRK